MLDDAWMAAERDAEGRLQADPEKFPSGMKALGDYIHGKGLKYGIYQDRGVMTCQKLPGSLGHEEIDMKTFAEWGVDYIKMDSCYAEKNGRTSWDDYAIFRTAIDISGRPMVLSISDFGNAAWVWGGRESAQLWRTSDDIRSKMRFDLHLRRDLGRIRADPPGIQRPVAIRGAGALERPRHAAGGQHGAPAGGRAGVRRPGPFQPVVHPGGAR